MEDKICKWCNITKSISCFNKHLKMPDGHINKCKKCEKQYKIEYYRNNPNAFRKWRDKNPNYYKKPEVHERIVRIRTNYLKNKRKTDINFKLKMNLRTRLNHALNGSLKANKTLNLLGCDIEFFKKYLETKFKENMTWENHGLYWEMDHIIPCSKFDLSIKENQILCFHYSNIQPLTKEENRNKRDKLILQD